MPLSNFIAVVKGLSLYPSTYPLPFWRPTTPTHYFSQFAHRVYTISVFQERLPSQNPYREVSNCIRTEWKWMQVNGCQISRILRELLISGRFSHLPFKTNTGDTLSRILIWNTYFDSLWILLHDL